MPSALHSLPIPDDCLLQFLLRNKESVPEAVPQFHIRLIRQRLYNKFHHPLQKTSLFHWHLSQQKPVPDPDSAALIFFTACSVSSAVTVYSVIPYTGSITGSPESSTSPTRYSLNVTPVLFECAVFRSFNCISIFPEGAAQTVVRAKTCTEHHCTDQHAQQSIHHFLHALPPPFFDLNSNRYNPVNTSTTPMPTAVHSTPTMIA